MSWVRTDPQRREWGDVILHRFHSFAEDEVRVESGESWNDPESFARDENGVWLRVDEGGEYPIADDTELVAILDGLLALKKSLHAILTKRYKEE